jgi:hypothetical protein
MQADLVNWDVMKGVAFSLSCNGLTRPEIVEFFWVLMVRHQREISEPNVDMIGDVNAHLVGQCSTSQIIRLVGDPEDLDELARRVSQAMQAWSPPDEHRPPDSTDEP